MNKILGVDVGATGVKGSVVNLDDGTLATERFKLATPEGGRPSDIAETVKAVVDHFDWVGQAVGIGFPSAILHHKVLTATNIHDSWVGQDVFKIMGDATGCPCIVVNDADAAGLAEVRYGKGKDVPGTLMLLTLGTGIGSAIFQNGQLLQNTEFGHVMYKGKIAEKTVSNTARKAGDLSWTEYGKELGEFLDYINRLFYPELIILGGGISKKFDNYADFFPKHINVTPASQFNNAGIIGAALSYELYS